MNTSLAPTFSPDTRRLFLTEYSLPFKLLIALLVFNTLRPDRLMPGGGIMLYFPLVLLCIIMVLWLTTPQKVLFNAQTKLFFGFIILMALEVLFARNGSWAFAQFKSMLLYAFIPYLFLVQYANTSFKVDKYIRLSFILSLFIGFLGLLKGAKIPIPALADENDFALLMNILIPIGYFLAQESSTLKTKVFYYSATLVLILANISSFSRGGLVGLVAVGLFIFLKSRNKITAILLLVLFATTIFLFAPQSYWDKIETITTQGAREGTGKERVESWKAGWKMFLDNPILGVGPRNFGLWLPEYYTEYSSKTSSNMWGRAAHSLYFTLLSEMGLTGTLLFSLMLWKDYKDHRYITSLEKRKENLLMAANLSNDEGEMVKVGIRRLYFLSLGYSGALIGFLTAGAFISVLWYGYFWTLTSFFVMSANVARDIEQRLHNQCIHKEIHEPET